MLLSNFSMQSCFLKYVTISCSLISTTNSDGATVMYIVDFQRAAYYQKCYDPDCQGKQGTLFQ